MDFKLDVLTEQIIAYGKKLDRFGYSNGEYYEMTDGTIVNMWRDKDNKVLRMTFIR